MFLKAHIAFLIVVCNLHAAGSGFMLGVNYSEWAPPAVTQMATDGSGAIYLLTSYLQSSNTPPSTVTKLSADGASIVWQNQLSFAVSTMAVDSNGGVYVSPLVVPGPSPTTVVKLNGSGSGIAWTLSSGLTLGTPPVLTADTQGRVYVVGGDISGPTGKIARINAAGTAVDYTASIAGIPTSIAVDNSGNAYVAGFGGKGIFLARLAPDGSAGFFSSVTAQEAAPTVALDTNGEEVVYASGKLQRYDSTGTLTLSKSFQAWAFNYQGLVLDASGNAYVTGSTQQLYPLVNTVTTCGTDMFMAIARDGTILQASYMPGGGTGPVLIAAANASVLVLDTGPAGFAPTRAGPFATGSQYLLSLSEGASSQALPLGCIGNAASYQVGPVAPGEIVTLFGNGLGPQQGIATTASFQNPFPTLAGGVQVTFDGKPAPLLWVQDSQVNAIAPWSLTPAQNTRVCVGVLGATSNCLTWAVAQTSPAVFTVDGFYAAALNQDGTVNSANNPAAAGSIVSIFGTGLGPITPAQPDGTLVGLPLPANALPLQVTSPMTVTPFGPPITSNIAFDVTYAGPAPYLVAGATQINFVVQPASSTFVSVGMVSSQPFRIYIKGEN